MIPRYSGATHKSMRKVAKQQNFVWYASIITLSWALKIIEFHAKYVCNYTSYLPTYPRRLAMV